MDVRQSTSSSSEYLKCKNCKQYIYHAPIFIETKSGKAVCHDCSTLSAYGSTLIRNMMAEVLLDRAFSVSCVYEEIGCTQKFSSLEKGLEHELFCSWRQVECPALDNCEWKGKLHTLVCHYQKKHGNLVIKDGRFKVKRDENLRANFMTLTPLKSSVILIQCDYQVESGDLFLDVCNFVESKITYTLTVVNAGDETLSFNKTKQVRGREYKSDTIDCSLAQKLPLKACASLLGDAIELTFILNIWDDETSDDETSDDETSDVMSTWFA